MPGKTSYLPLGDDELVSPVASPLVEDPDVSSEDFPALGFFAFGLFSGLASEPAAVGAGDVPEVVPAPDPDSPVLPVPEELSDALLPEADEPDESDVPEESEAPDEPEEPETADGLSPVRVAPDGNASLVLGAVSTGPALPEGMALPWSCGMGPDDEVALLTDPEPCAKAADDSDAIITKDRV